MNRNEFEKAVYESDLDAQSKQILGYYAYKKHWNNNGKVWPSNTTTSRETALSASTVDRRVPKLRDAGWLIDTGERVGNGTIVYDLAIGNHCLSDSGTTVCETGTTVCETGTTVTVTDKEVKNKLEEVKEEVKIQKSTSPDGPVEDKSSLVEIREDLVVTPPAAVDKPTSLNIKTTDDSLNFDTSFERCWLTLDSEEKRHFELSGATDAQRKQAVVMYKTHSPNGYGWRDKADKSLAHAGVEIDEW